jgi:hypothetical protein
MSCVGTMPTPGRASLGQAWHDLIWAARLGLTVCIGLNPTSMMRHRNGSIALVRSTAPAFDFFQIQSRMNHSYQLLSIPRLWHSARESAIPHIVYVLSPSKFFTNLKPTTCRCPEWSSIRMSAEIPLQRIDFWKHINIVSTIIHTGLTH